MLLIYIICNVYMQGIQHKARFIIQRKFLTLTPDGFSVSSSCSTSGSGCSLFDGQTSVRL
jgi:hypothetical protein